MHARTSAARTHARDAKRARTHAMLRAEATAHGTRCTRLRRQGVPGDVEVPPLAGADAPPLPLAAVGVAAGSACAPLAAVVLASVTPAAAGTTGVPSTAAAAPGCRVEAAVLPPDVALPSLRLELARVLARDDMLTRVGARFRWWRFWTVGGRCECDHESSGVFRAGHTQHQQGRDVRRARLAGRGKEARLGLPRRVFSGSP